MTENSLILSKVPGAAHFVIISFIILPIAQK
jgi:hypothetical protein